MTLAGCNTVLRTLAFPLRQCTQATATACLRFRRSGGARRCPGSSEAGAIFCHRSERSMARAMWLWLKLAAGKGSQVDGGGSGGACGVLGDERQARANGSADGNAASSLKSTGRLWLFVASESFSPRYEGRESTYTPTIVRLAPKTRLLCSCANKTCDLKRFLGSNRRRKTCCGEGFLANEGTSDQLTCCQGVFWIPKAWTAWDDRRGTPVKMQKSHDVCSALFYFYASARGLASAAHVWPWPRGWRGTMATGSRLQGLPWPRRPTGPTWCMECMAEAVGVPGEPGSLGRHGPPMGVW